MSLPPRKAAERLTPALRVPWSLLPQLCRAYREGYRDGYAEAD